MATRNAGVEPVIGTPEDTFNPENVWLLFDAPDDEEASHEANIFRGSNFDGFYVEWSHTAVGLVTQVFFDSLEAAEAWLTEAGYQDFSS